jgi:hypothetical protein
MQSGNLSKGALNQRWRKATELALDELSGLDEDAAMRLLQIVPMRGSFATVGLKRQKR